MTVSKTEELAEELADVKKKLRELRHRHSSDGILHSSKMQEMQDRCDGYIREQLAFTDSPEKRLRKLVRALIVECRMSDTGVDLQTDLPLGDQLPESFLLRMEGRIQNWLANLAAIPVDNIAWYEDRFEARPDGQPRS